MSETGKPGRKPIGDKPMTAAERKRAQRARQKAEKKTETCFVLPDDALAELASWASSYDQTRNDLLALMVEGQMKCLRKVEMVVAELMKSCEPERIELIRHKALLLIKEGIGVELLLTQIAEESLAKLEAKIENHNRGD